MRITCKIANTGQHYCVLVPDVTRGKETCRNENGKIVPLKSAKLLQAPGITPSSNDDLLIQTWAWEILNNYQLLVSGEHSDDSPGGEHAERRLEDGKFAYVRIELKKAHGKYVSNITYELNDHAQAKTAKKAAEDFVALMEKLADAVAGGLGMKGV